MNLTFNLIAGLPGALETTASVAGDIITVNGTAYDLSLVPEGGQAEPQGDHPFVGYITRESGKIHAAILWQYDAATAQSDQGEYPVLNITGGTVPDPVLRKQEGAQ